MIVEILGKIFAIIFFVGLGYLVIANIATIFLFSFKDMIKELKVYKTLIGKILMVLLYLPAFIIKFVFQIIFIIGR